MKILLVTVVFIAAFQADCRHFSDEPSDQVSTSDYFLLLRELVKSDNNDEDQIIFGSTEGPQSGYKEEHAPLSRDGNQYDEILRGKGGKKNLQKLIKKFEFLNYNLTQENLKMKMELQHLRDNQNNISDTNTKQNVLVLSKMENISNGGKQLKIELQYLREKQNNISDTDAKLKMMLLNKMENNSNVGNQLIMELQQSMKDQQKNISNADNELKIELQSIKDQQKNISNTDNELKMELQSIKDQQNNITNGDKELKMELSFVMQNISNGDMQLKDDIQSIIENQNNITETDTFLKMELQAVMKNITQSNSGLKNDVNAIKNNMNSQNSNIVSKLNYIGTKLDTIQAGQGCPKDFFQIPPSQQCFKYFADVKLNWYAANSKCQLEGLALAKPSAPIAVRNFLVSTYGSDTYSWLGARGDNAYMKWQRDETKITTSNPYWWPLHPHGVTTRHCLELFVHSNNPTRPFTAHYCSTRKVNTLCELVRG